MKTVDFQVKKSLLGFGTMRLPVNEQGKIDDVQVREMIVYTMSHGGESETVIGCVLKEYPRDSYYLATKYSGHHILSSGYNAREIFEEQLVKCEVDDFDFYLLHNVYEKSMETYLDPVWGIEPVCGGKLANLDEETEIQMKKLRPDESIASWSFRFLQTIPNVSMVLSGMSNMKQIKDNIKTFSEGEP